MTTHPIPYDVVLDGTSALIFVWFSSTGRAGVYDTEGGELIAEVEEGQRVTCRQFMWQIPGTTMWSEVHASNLS